MSYVDNENGRRVSPASLGATLLINGALVALVVSFTPGVMDIIKDPDRPIIWIPTVPPEPVPEDTPPDARKRAESDVVKAPPPPASGGATGTNTMEGVKADAGEWPDLPPVPADPDPLPGPRIEPTIEPVRIGPKVDPRYASAMQPAYPLDMARDEKDGKVTVRVLVGVDGRVKMVERVSATSDSFFEATRRHAITKWRFKPATVDGAPVEGWREMSVRFEMKA